MIIQFNKHLIKAQLRFAITKEACASRACAPAQRRGVVWNFAHVSAAVKCVPVTVVHPGQQSGAPHTCCLMLLMMQLTAHVHQSWFQMPFNAAHTQKIQIHLSKQTFVMEAVCCWPGRQFPILNSEEHLVQSPRHGGEHLPPRVTAVGGFILILASLSYLLKYLLGESELGRGKKLKFKLFIFFLL